MRACPSSKPVPKPVASRRAPRSPASPAVKNYILDTNVLLHDPHSLLSFQDNRVLIPIEVIEEIDRFKRESSELGQNARAVSRQLDALRSQGHLSEGVPLPNGGSLKIIFQSAKESRNGEHVFGDNTVDNRILSLAANVLKSSPAERTILVTKDINLRIKADALGLQAEDLRVEQPSLEDVFLNLTGRAYRD